MTKKQNKMKFYEINYKCAAFLTVFFWASAFVVSKYVLMYVDVKSLVVIRHFLAGLIFVLFIFYKKRKKRIKKMELSDIPLFLLSGFVGYSGYFIIYNMAITKISPSTAAFINTLSPGITSIIAHFIFKERLKILSWIALGISFYGVFVLSVFDVSYNLGIIYMLIACILISLYHIFQKKIICRYTSFEATAYSVLMGTIQLILYSPESLSSIFSMKFSIFSLILYMAIFPSVVAYILWSEALEKCKNTTEVTSFMFLTPLIATIMSILFLNDMPQKSTFIGGCIIVLGMIIFNKIK